MLTGRAFGVGCPPASRSSQLWSMCDFDASFMLGQVIKSEASRQPTDSEHLADTHRELRPLGLGAHFDTEVFQQLLFQLQNVHGATRSPMLEALRPAAPACSGGKIPGVVWGYRYHVAALLRVAAVLASSLSYSKSR